MVKDNKTKLCRIRKEDYNKLMGKKSLIEKDLFRITGKSVKLSTPQLFNLAVSSTWDLGSDYKMKLRKVGRGRK